MKTEPLRRIENNEQGSAPISDLPTRALPISVLESPSGFLVRADLPGVTKDRISIDFELGMLFLEADFTADTSDQEEVLLQEASSSRYKRTLKMSSEIDTEAIAASLELGVLTVILPKRQNARKRRVPIFSEGDEV